MQPATGVNLLRVVRTLETGVDEASTACMSDRLKHASDVINLNHTKAQTRHLDCCEVNWIQKCEND